MTIGGFGVDTVEQAGKNSISAKRRSVADEAWQTPCGEGTENFILCQGVVMVEIFPVMTDAAISWLRRHWAGDDSRRYLLPLTSEGEV